MTDFGGDWVQETDESSGSPYYVNRVTGETTWNYPLESCNGTYESGNWTEIFDKTSGFFYYTNDLTGKSTWDKPANYTPTRAPVHSETDELFDEDIHTDSRSLLMERDSLTPSPRFGDSSEATEKTSIRYKSTRGGEVDVTFRDAILKGLAEDDGLFVPERIPTFSMEEINKMRKLSYAGICYKVMSKFIGPDQIPAVDLKSILKKSYANFRAPEVTPCVPHSECWLLELFHGPTFAYEDVAMQFLGHLCEYLLCSGDEEDSPKFLTALGATTGDTGSAAIHGFKGKKNMTCFVSYPEGHPTDIQERQMTTVTDDNVFCISHPGDFDDVQLVVKEAFRDKKFSRSVNLVASNSINWARVLAQTTYYFYAWLRVTSSIGKCDSDMLVNFSVPCSNFGNMLAGYYAKRMGLPIGKLIVCTNENSIIHKFLETGIYHRAPSQHTIVPSMDVSISSNFERYLFYLADEESSTLASWMRTFEATGDLFVPYTLLDKARQDFVSHSANRSEIIVTMRDFWHKENYLLSPQSATAVAGIRYVGVDGANTVCMCTSHPGKFREAVELALIDSAPPPLPLQLESLLALPVRSQRLPLRHEAVKAFIKKKAIVDKGDMQLYYFSIGVAALAIVGIFVLGQKRK